MLILILAAFMGGVLFYNLNDVTGVLCRITERSASSIRYPTGIERYVLQTILAEKNYLISQKKEIHEQAMRDIREIYANLDWVDQTATKYNDQVLLGKSKDVRRVVEKYRGYYNRVMAFLEENKALEHKMRMLGRKMCDLSHTHMLEHKRLLGEAIATGIDQGKRMEIFYLCTEIEIEALEARRQVKNYLLYKKQEHFDGLKEHIANLRILFDAIRKIDHVSEHQPLIEKIYKATDEYLAAVEKCVANDNGLRVMLAEMHEIGLIVQETVRGVQDTGWQEMDKSAKTALLITQRAYLTGILVAVITLITGILGTFFIARGIADPIKEESFQAIVNKNPCGTIIVDSEGIVQFVNPTAAAIFCKTAEELIGSMFGLPVTAGEKMEIDIVQQGGQKGVAEMHVVETHWLGQPAYLTSIFDITTIKKAEDLLIKANEDLKKLDEMKTDFIATASHELRTPLTSIKNAVDILATVKTGKLNQSQERFLAMAFRNIERLSLLINNLLDFSNIEAGTANFNCSEVNVAGLFRQTVDAFKPQADDKLQILEADYPEDLPTMYADCERVEQILYNLVSNALKYTPEGGKVRLSARIVDSAVADKAAMAKSAGRLPQQAVDSDLAGMNDDVKKRSGFIQESLKKINHQSSIINGLRSV